MTDPKPADQPLKTQAAQEPATEQTQANSGLVPEGGTKTFGDQAAPAQEIPFNPPLEAGDLGSLDKYRVIKVLGQGGMGAVYLGQNPKLNRFVALKVMLPRAAAQAGAKERFLREALATAALKHDHIVTVYDADECNGVPYIAIEYLKGTSLDDYLKKKGNLSLGQVIRIGRETALGLQAAHDVGLVHRDIKPANIWLEAPKARVKILDFGLAKPVNDTQVEITQSGMILGTPSYMSPEQARGKKTDARTDLFSLGVMLYRLTTGQLPFPGENIMAILTALAADEPIPVRQLNPKVPPALAELIEDLLKKNPDQRPGRAHAVAERLAEIERNPNVATRDDIPSAQPVVEALPNSSLQVSVQQESAFAHLEDDLEQEKPVSEPVRRAPGKVNKKLGLILGGLGTLVVGLVGIAVILVLSGLVKLKKEPEPAPTDVAESKTGSNKAPGIPEGWNPDDAAWQESFLKLRPEKQKELFTAELRRLNPE